MSQKASEKEFEKEINRLAKRKGVQLVRPVKPLSVSGDYSLANSNVPTPFAGKPMMAKAM